MNQVEQITLILNREKDQLRAEIERLKCELEIEKANGTRADDYFQEIERLRALICDKQYIQLLADYNRGHLSHHGWLRERDGGIRETYDQAMGLEHGPDFNR